jgi:hypothetical protein
VPPLSHKAFLQRLLRQCAYAGALIAASVMLGMAGYHWIAGFSWIDAFMNASMLLGGMGPIGDLRGDAAKLFAGVFALYSGLVFLAVELLLLTPIFHRVLHRFHAEASQRETH